MPLSESPLATILFAAYIAALWTVLLLIVWWGVSAWLKQSPQFGNLGLHSLILAFLLGELAGILTPASPWADNPEAPIYNSIFLGSWLGAFLGALWVITSGYSRLQKLGWLELWRSLLSQLMFPTPQSRISRCTPPSRLDFKHQSLQGHSFRRQVLNGANFEGANLERADFSNARLIGANFRGAIAPQANFTGARLAGATFDEAQLTQAAFDRVHGFRPFWRCLPIQVQPYRELAEPWCWLLLWYGLVSLTALVLLTQRATAIVVGLMLICILLLLSLLLLVMAILTGSVVGGGVAVLVLMVNASYLLSTHPVKTSLPLRVEIGLVIIAGAIALLGLVQKRWTVFATGLGMLCASSAVALMPFIFRDQLPFPLLYSGIFSIWGLAIGHLVGRGFERGVCSFCQAQLNGATFVRADIRFAQFHGAIVQASQFTQARTKGSPTGGSAHSPPKTL